MTTGGERAGRRYVGRPALRVEDKPLLTGGGGFLDDLDREGQLHARVVRSPVAAGRIRSIDPRTALDLEGVEAVFTAKDVPAVRVPQRVAPSPETRSATWASRWR